MKARLLAAVVTLAATLAVGVAGRPAEVQAAPGCADVLFIGVHGVGEDPISGEPPTKANGNNNMGPTIYRMFTDFRNKVRAQSPSTNVGGFGVNYPKIGIGQLVGQRILGGLAGNNVAEGVRALKQAVTTQIRVCPGHAIVLAGYSEGAWVIGRFFRDNPTLANSITAVTFFGDPQFDPNATRFIRGGTNGIGVARAFGLGINPYLPSVLRDRAASWCLAEPQGNNLIHDPICNSVFTTRARNEFIGLTDCVRGRPQCVHFRYGSSGLLAAGADFLISKLPPRPGHDCEAFIADVTVPDGTTFSPGASYTKTWRLRNCGTTDWSGLTAVRVDGNIGPGSFPVPRVAPGGTADLSAAMTAPSAPGHYRSTYRLRAADGHFADNSFWVDINVTGPTSPNRYAVTSYDRMAAGAPHHGYFTSAWQNFVARSNRITYLGVTVGNPRLSAGQPVAANVTIRLCTTPSCSAVLAERSPQIINYGNSAVDIGDVAVTPGATYYVVWYQPAAAAGSTWVTYWWAGGPRITQSDQLQAVVKGYNA